MARLLDSTDILRKGVFDVASRVDTMVYNCCTPRLLFVAGRLCMGSGLGGEDGILWSISFRQSKFDTYLCPFQRAEVFKNLRSQSHGTLMRYNFGFYIYISHKHINEHHNLNPYHRLDEIAVYRHLPFAHIPHPRRLPCNPSTSKSLRSQVSSILPQAYTYKPSTYLRFFYE